jgi:hypothetical protein
MENSTNSRLSGGCFPEAQAAKKDSLHGASVSMKKNSMTCARVFDH